MQRDMDLLRTLLLEIEKLPFNGGQWVGSLKIPGHSDEEVCYHALMAQDAGFIEAKFLQPTPYFAVHRLTYEGHEFLDAARDEKLWAKAKDKVRSTTGTLTIDALKTTLSFLIQQALKAGLQ